MAKITTDGVTTFTASAARAAGACAAPISAASATSQKCSLSDMVRSPSGEPSGSGRPPRGRQAARSATTASSTGKPAGVTRRQPSPSLSTKPCSLSVAMRRGSSGRPASACVARRVDAFGEAQAPSAGIRRRAPRRVSSSSVIDAVAERLDPHQPGFRALLGRGGVAAAVDVEPAVRAGADAGIFVVAPIDEIVPALGARPRVVGDLVGRQARARRRSPASCRRARGAVSSSGMTSLPAACSAANGVSGSMVS